MANFSYTSSLGILGKAGAFVSSDVSNALLLKFADAAEALINGIIRVNLSTEFANLNANLREIAADAADSYAGMLAIQYDPTTYPSLAAAQTQLNVLRDNVQRAIDLMKEDKWKTFVSLT